MGNNPSTVVESFVAEYETPAYQEALMLLESDWTEQSQQFVDGKTLTIERWAKDIYVTLRHSPSDERCKDLNDARKTCLKLLYKIVRTWSETFHYNERFAIALKDIFLPRRVARILGYCLPMDRAQALYKMRMTNHQVGMPWFSKLHLLQDTAYAVEFPDEQAEWQRIAREFQAKDPLFQPPMSGKLFRLLYECDTLQLRNIPDLARWARPFQLSEAERQELQTSPAKRKSQQGQQSSVNGPPTVTVGLSSVTIPGLGGEVPGSSGRSGSPEFGMSKHMQQWTNPSISLGSNPLMSVASESSNDDEGPNVDMATKSFAHMEFSVQQAMHRLAESRLLYRSSRTLQREPPDRKAAVLFTDVQGSTRLWEADADAMNAALKLHDQIMRSNLQAHNGYEVKTEGDAFHVSFHTPVDALGFALKAQQDLYDAAWEPALLNLPDASDDQDDGFRGLRVRMAIHYGEVGSQVNALSGRREYTGDTLAVAKALEEMAHGGQILVSGDVWNAVSYQAQTLGYPQVIDLGTHVLHKKKKKKKTKTTEATAEANDTTTTVGHHNNNYIAKPVLQLVPLNLAYNYTMTQTSADNNASSLSSHFSGLTSTRPSSMSTRSRSYEPEPKTGRQFPPALTKKKLTPSFHDAPHVEGEVTMLFVYTTAIEQTYEGQLSTLSPGLAKRIGNLVGPGPGYQCKDLMVAFPDETAAVTFGLALQDSVAAEPIVVDNRDESAEQPAQHTFDLTGLLKVGLHAGEFTKLEPNQTNGRADYFGRVVNRAARVASVTEPGCVYLGAFEGDDVTLDAGLEATFVGTRELKGLNEEMGLYKCSRKETKE